MEIAREGSSTTRPHILDEKNYSYWRTRMTSFIKSLDVKAWKAFKVRWTQTMVTVDGKSVPKSEEDWTDEEKQESIENSCTLNVIYN